MRARIAILAAALLVIGACSSFEPIAPVEKSAEKSPQQNVPVRVGDYRLSGPYTHDNLTVFLMHGKDRLKGRKFVMLADALEKKQFVIHETQKVNELQMENLSNEEVLILSGDILKGGQQDRIAQNDQFVPPKSGKLPLTVFCVEHTAPRWMRKMTEKDQTFYASPGQLTSNELRLANRYRMNQGEVWANVAKAQSMLSASVGKSVKAKKSDSSLALSLGAKEVKKAADEYIAKLKPLVADGSDVVGFAFAINGKVVAADVYGSPDLFRKLWPRLITASALEAVAEKKKGKSFPAVTAAVVKSFIAEGDKGKATTKDVSMHVRQEMAASKNVLRFSSFGAKKEEKKAGSIRRNYLAH